MLSLNVIFLVFLVAIEGVWQSEPLGYWFAIRFDAIQGRQVKVLRLRLPPPFKEDSTAESLYALRCWQYTEDRNALAILHDSMAFSFSDDW